MRGMQAISAALAFMMPFPAKRASSRTEQSQYVSTWKPSTKMTIGWVPASKGGPMARKMRRARNPRWV